MRKFGRKMRSSSLQSVPETESESSLYATLPKKMAVQTVLLIKMESLQPKLCFGYKTERKMKNYE